LELLTEEISGRMIMKITFIYTKAAEKGPERIFIAPSCSLLHSPCDLDFETELNPKSKTGWLLPNKSKKK
jgi:5-methyltetrahydropteroyltriglutamate--homocysteine methyltransferase